MYYKIAKQLNIVKNGLSVIIFRKIITLSRMILLKFILFTLIIIFFPIFIFLIILSSYYVIRIGLIRADRIGHLALEIETYLCEIDAGMNIPNSKYKDIFFIEGKISNEQLVKMWRRKLIVLPYFILKPLYILNIKFFKDKFNPLKLNYDNNNLLDKSKVHISFNDEEKVFGENELKKLGILNQDRFICVLVRDNAYLHNFLGGNWDYHDYRDCNIENFILAMNNLTNLGYYVIRMGAIVNNKIKTNNPRIIDYAGKGLRTDFMDVFLASKCTFCISTGAGWDILPSWLFKKPTIYTNILPLGMIPTYSSNFLLITKTHFSIKKNKNMNFSEIIESGAATFTNSHSFCNAEIKLIENTPEEIWDISFEMHQRLEKKWVETKEMEDNNITFEKMYPKNIKDSFGRPFHGKIKSRYSSLFLLKNKTWLSQF